jgi:hypothetical protein
LFIMKKTVVTVLLFVLASAASFAGETRPPADFETAHKEDQAIVLLFDMDVKVNEDWSYTTHVHQRIKIQKDDAKAMGEVPITYFKGAENVSGIKAFTITPDGKRHRYTKIQDRNANEEDLTYSDNRLKQLTLPEVNIGSILDAEYTIRSKGLPMKNSFWGIYDPGSGMSYKEFRFSVSFPRKFNIKYRTFGLSQKPAAIETASQITYTWTVHDIDGTADVDESTPPPAPDDYKNTIELSSIPNWSDFSAWYMSLIKKNQRATPAMHHLAAELTQGKNSVREKARAIKEYIGDNFRYVSMSFANHAMEPHSADEVFANKYGDCKDLSLLVKTLLKEAGIDSWIALFRNEDAANDPTFDLPVPAVFDHALLLVKDPQAGDFYLDPLLKDYDIGEYPLEDQKAYTFVVTQDGGRMDRFPVFDEARSHNTRNQDIVIAEDGSDTIVTDSVSYLDDSIATRNNINGLDQDARDKFYESMDSMVAGNGTMVERKIDGLNRKYGPLTYHTVIKRQDDYSVTDDIMIINISAVEQTFAFTSRERKKPIFSPYNILEEESTVYHVPDGFNIYYMPKDVDLDTGFYHLTRQYKQEGREIRLTQVTRLRREEHPAAEYAKIKTFFDQLPGRTEQRIILRKK